MKYGRVGFVFLTMFLVIFSTTVGAQNSGDSIVGSGETLVEKALTIHDDEEFKNAVEWMYRNGMTKFQSTESFKGEDLVKREHAAKFFSQFAKETLYATMDMGKYCWFGDLNDADPSLKNYILEACLFSLFQGSSGKFSPKKIMTKDQVIAVLMRAILGEFLDESGEIWWKEYYTKAYEAGITKETDLEKFSQPVSRYELALLLWRASQLIEATR